MSLQITEALRYGFDRLTKRNALVLFVAFAFVGIVATAGSQTTGAGLFELFTNIPEIQDTAGYEELLQQSEQYQNQPLVLPGGFAVGLVLWLAGYLLGEAVRIVSDRTFVSEETETLYQPTRRLAPAVVFSIAATLLVAGGFALLLAILLFVGFVLPGTAGNLVLGLGVIAYFVVVVYVGLGIYFVRQEIAVFDKGPIDALTGSWSLVSGHRLPLLGFAIVVGILSAVVGFVVSAALGVVGLAATLVGNLLLGAVFSVFGSAAAAGLYRQLLGIKRPDSEFALTTFGDDYGGIDEEWR